VRRAAVILGSVLLLVVLAAAVAVTVQRLRTSDPLAALPRDERSRVTVVEERREAWQGRSLLHVTLDGEAVGRVRFVVSLPDPPPRGRVPLVVVLGGLRGGSNSIREITKVVGDPGPNAFVGYDWPLPARAPAAGELLRGAPEFRRNVLTVPGQVDAILAWAAQRPWADRDRVSLLGFSLGAFVVPAAQRLAEERGVPVGWTILAYAGAPIGAVIAGHPKAGPAWARPLLGAGADLLLRPVEPSLHLPHLRGRFLVLGAATDRLVDRAAAERMEALTPEPRTVVRVEGDHMGVGPDKWKLLARVVEVSRAWLLEQGAIDPAGPEPARGALGR
jgi:hypothetical protein